MITTRRAEITIRVEQGATTAVAVRVKCANEVRVARVHGATKNAALELATEQIGQLLLVTLLASIRTLNEKGDEVDGAATTTD